MAVLTYLVYRFNASPNKIPAKYTVDINKLILKVKKRGKRLRRGNTVLKESNDGRLTVPNVNKYYKATVMKTWWYGQKNR